MDLSLISGILRSIADSVTFMGYGFSCQGFYEQKRRDEVAYPHSKNSPCDQSVRRVISEAAVMRVEYSKNVFRRAETWPLLPLKIVSFPLLGLLFTLKFLWLDLLLFREQSDSMKLIGCKHSNCFYWLIFLSKSYLVLFRLLSMIYLYIL